MKYCMGLMVLLSMFLASAPALSEAKQMDTTKLATPRKAVEAYFQSSFMFDASILESAFSQEAVIEGYIGEDYHRWVRDEFIRRIGSFPPPGDDDRYDKKIISVKETANTAVVHARTLVGAVYFEDYLLLVKTHDEWSIVHKIFHAE